MDIVLFPELVICGYPPEDLLLHFSFIDAIEHCLEEIVHATYGLVAIVGVPRRNLEGGGKPLFNSAAIIEDGKLIGYQDKWLLPTYDVFDERRYFEPGKEMRVWNLKGLYRNHLKNRDFGKKAPQNFDPERATIAERQGASEDRNSEVEPMPSKTDSSSSFGIKTGIIICEDIWRHAGYVGDARYEHDPVLELLPYKIDLLLNLSASPYQFQKPDIRVEVCAKAAKTLKCPVILCCQVGANDQLVFDGYSVYVDKEGRLRQLGKAFVEDEMKIDLSAESCPCPYEYDPMHDLYRALVLGVKDYFNKLGFRQGCLGLSGGIDSALVACIAVEALGKENVFGINMPSCYSSKEGIADAKQLAETLGISYTQLSIEKSYEDYLALLKPLFAGKGMDVTEENLQARIRGVILMAISNKLGYVVLSTGNKSEMAMGYCTLYGDMAGGLSVISDVTKTLVYSLARWINREKEIIPATTIDRAPSAELRKGQKDSDSLPEYAIVDMVLQAYVEDYLSPKEISEKYSMPLELVIDLVRRIHRAEYKRRQAAPGIRVSKKAFRVGRRYPIVQGWI